MLQKAKSSHFTLDTLLGSLELVVYSKEWNNFPTQNTMGREKGFICAKWYCK